MVRRRLRLQIYTTIVASLITVAVLTGTMWAMFGRDHLNQEIFDVSSRLAYLSLPPAGATAADQEVALRRFGRELDIDMSLFDRRGELIAAYGDVLPAPPERRRRSGWHRGHRGPGWALSLPDGRWLVIDPGRRVQRRPLVNLLLLIASIAAGVGLAAWPLVRRLTRRLETLQQGVERIGAGELSARVEVQGRDEIARLAESFNTAADKIEDLVNAHRLLLANASHELRTPLSRIRLGIDLLHKDGDPARRAALEKDIAELDDLIGEILLMSRLDAGSHVDMDDIVDLLALAAEECAHYDGCRVKGVTAEVKGDAALLRRMLRNLLDNADKHGKPPTTVEVSKTATGVMLSVRDAGPGITEADRERVFRPFYREAGKQNVDGYGLGLPLVRQIAEAHGGTAAVSGEPGEASRIVVTLPGV